MSPAGAQATADLIAEAPARDRARRLVMEALSRGLPGDRLVVDPDVLAALSHDEAEWAPTGQAAAAVRARSETEVQHVVRTCAELGVPSCRAARVPACPAAPTRSRAAWYSTCPR